MWRIKGSAIHGTIATLKRHGLYEEIYAAMSPRIRGLMDHPPARTGWIDVLDLAEIDQALLERKGPAFLRKFAHEAVSAGTLPGYLPLIQGMTRLFGSTPHTLFSRVTPLIASHIQGMTYLYEELGPHHGRFTTRYEGAHPVPEVIGVSFAGLLSLAFDLAPVSSGGSISDATIVKAPTHTTLSWDLRW